MEEPKMSKNLWPEFELAENLRSPKTIIAEHVAGLRERTEGLVGFSRPRTHITGEEVTLSFDLYAPTLRYSFPFLQVRFSIQNNYPVRLIADKMDEFTANNEDELIAGLSKIFTAPSTVQTIQQLLSLASDTQPTPSF
jgi:hypothetical protein